jgi:hypothetical protein
MRKSCQNAHFIAGKLRLSKARDLEEHSANVRLQSRTWGYQRAPEICPHSFLLGRVNTQ